MGDNKDVTENTIYRWRTGSCKPLGGQDKMWCQGGANATQSKCITPKGSSGGTTYTYTGDYWWWQDPKCPGGFTKTTEHGGWSPWFQHHAHCKKTTPNIPKRTRCYWEEKMNEKVVPKARKVRWPKYDDDWAKCKLAVSKELVQPQATFKPGLVPPGLCEKFKQEFPCMSPNALTGPHSGDCLTSLWKNSGCAGDVNTQISKSGLNSGTIFNAWNTHSYSDAGANMNAFPKDAQSSNYDTSQKYTKACFNENVDSCNPRFYPRPKECTSRLWNAMGGRPAGKLNPKNENKWPTDWVPGGWKKEGTWSINRYQNNVARTVNKARTSKAMLRQQPRDYDTAAKTNMQIYGNKPAPPFAKPCWGDMLDMAKSLKSAGVTVSGKAYIDYNNARQFNLLPNTNDLNRIKNGDLNVYNYRLYKQTFNNSNFPYWDAVWKYEDYWKANWNKFKSILSSVRGVISDDNMIGLSKNMFMSEYVTGANLPTKCIPNARIRKMKGDFRMRPWGRTYDTDYHGAVTKCRNQTLLYPRSMWKYFCSSGWGKGRCELSSQDNNYVYITKESYNKPGFPYALLVKMSQ